MNKAIATIEINQRDGVNGTMRYAILGKLTARPKIDGKRVKVHKKAHMLRAGRTLCRAENAYKKQPRYTPVENPEPDQVCQICLGLDVNKGDRHPQLPDDPILTDPLGLGRAARADALERFELGEGEYAEPLLSVLMGERVA